MEDIIKRKQEDKIAKISAASEILSNAEKRGEKMTADEDAKFEALHKEAAELTSDINKYLRQRDAEKEAASISQTRAHVDVETRVKTPQTREEWRATEAYRSAYWKSEFGRGRVELNDEEKRALSAGTDSEGGYTAPPTQFVATLIKELNDAVYMRGKGNIITLSGGGDSITRPKRAAKLGNLTWTTELGTGSADSTYAFGQLVISGRPLARRILISEDLLNESALNIEQEVISEFVTVFGEVMESNYFTGDGTSESPVGIFNTSHADAIPTTRDAQNATGNTTNYTYDGLVDCKYKVKSAYRAGCEWLIHRDGIAKVAKLKDSNNDPIWRAGLAAGEPDTLLGHAIMESEFAPNTFTAGLYIAAFFNPKYYDILDIAGFKIKRLNELYAETNQIGMIGRYKGGAKPRDAQAFARLKTSAT